MKPKDKTTPDPFMENLKRDITKKIRAKMKAIDLGPTVDKATRQDLNFSDSRLSDEHFVAQLVKHLTWDDQGIRAGSNGRYLREVEQDCAQAVGEIVATIGLSDRNRVITEAYNRCSNSKSDNGNCRFYPTPFLKGSDYELSHANFRDYRLSDEKFLARLTEELANDCGYKALPYIARGGPTKEQEEFRRAYGEKIAAVVAKTGLTDRDLVISAAYEACRATPGLDYCSHDPSSFLKGSSTALRAQALKREAVQKPLRKI